MGNFDHTKGGHLVLPDLGVVIEFPSGSAALIASGSCRHGNTKIQPGETRYSFTQFSAGGIFRWVNNGFQKETDWEAQASASEIEAAKKAKEERWQFGLSLLPTLSELGIALAEDSDSRDID